MRAFDRWMRSVALPEAELCRAVREISKGLIDANLGGGVVKKRVALPGRGKRGGCRVLIATDRRDRWFVLAGFRKNERDDISERELVALQSLATDLLKLSDIDLTQLIVREALREICHEDDQETQQPDPEGGARDRLRSQQRRLH